MTTLPERQIAMRVSAKEVFEMNTLVNLHNILSSEQGIYVGAKVLEKWIQMTSMCLHNDVNYMNGTLPGFFAWEGRKTLNNIVSLKRGMGGYTIIPPQNDSLNLHKIMKFCASEKVGRETLSMFRETTQSFGTLSSSGLPSQGVLEFHKGLRPASFAGSPRTENPLWRQANAPALARSMVGVSLNERAKMVKHRLPMLNQLAVRETGGAVEQLAARPRLSPSNIEALQLTMYIYRRLEENPVLNKRLEENPLTMNKMPTGGLPLLGRKPFMIVKNKIGLKKVLNFFSSNIV